MSNDNEERNIEINNQLIKLAIKNEKNMRESKTNAKLLEIAQKESKRNIMDLEDKMINEKKKLKEKEQINNMEKEDAFSASLRWKLKYAILEENFTDLKLINEENEEKIKKLTINFDKLEEEFEIVKEKLEGTQNKLKDTEYLYKKEMEELK